MGNAPFDCFCEGASRRTELVVLLVCAHPDDETIGAGARLNRLDALHLAYTTDGAPGPTDFEGRPRAFTELARCRRDELDAALRVGSVLASTCTWIGFADQQTSHHLPLLTHRIHALITTVRPDLILTHPYEGGHPDHDAAAFAVAHACRLLSSAGQPVPLHAEFTSYHARNGEICTGRFLRDATDQRTIELDDAERARKSCMLACFESQRDMLRWFDTEHESFRPAPLYDFTQPPHDGRLFYDYFDWGITGQYWRTLASIAEHELLAEVAPC